MSVEFFCHHISGRCLSFLSVLFVFCVNTHSSIFCLGQGWLRKYHPDIGHLMITCGEGGWLCWSLQVGLSPCGLQTLPTQGVAPFFISKFNLIFLEIVSYVTKTLDSMLCGTVHREARVAVESSNADDNFDQNRLSFSSHLVTLMILPPPTHLVKSSLERNKRAMVF